MSCPFYSVVTGWYTFEKSKSGYHLCQKQDISIYGFGRSYTSFFSLRKVALFFLHSDQVPINCPQDSIGISKFVSGNKRDTSWPPDTSKSTTCPLYPYVSQNCIQPTTQFINRKKHTRIFVWIVFDSSNFSMTVCYQHCSNLSQKFTFVSKILRRRRRVTVTSYTVAHALREPRVVWFQQRWNKILSDNSVFQFLSSVPKITWNWEKVSYCHPAKTHSNSICISTLCNYHHKSRHGIFVTLLFIRKQNAQQQPHDKLQDLSRFNNCKYLCAKLLPDRCYSCKKSPL